MPSGNKIECKHDEPNLEIKPVLEENKPKPSLHNSYKVLSQDLRPFNKSN